ncbi:isoamylase early set domain-containing protein, partial [Roseisolibacter sp. H3M3-2]|uniref:isoamylase early set domain-containing protein n=1 Tax=Roseisolibacter sp. H3M3-2 TaxID=3031323 RepID=UPI0023D97B36
ARAWGWMVRPRAIRVSPIGALAAAGLAFVAASFGLRRDAGRRAGDEGQTGEFPRATGEFPAIVPVAARAPQGAVPTRFVFVAPSAKSVTIVGDFNDWDTAATPLVKHQGVWTTEVTLPPGRYAYAFLVDGQRWIADPDAPPAVGDDFGRPSSVVTVRRTDA